MSYLINVVPDAQQPDEPENHEFGSYCFGELEPTKIMEIACTDIIETQEVSHKYSEASMHLQKRRDDGINGDKRSPLKYMRPTHSKDSKHLWGLRKIPCVKITKTKMSKK